MEDEIWKMKHGRWNMEDETWKMEDGKTFDMEKEFEGINFNSQRLENRFRRTMTTRRKHPNESILGCSKNRAEAKSIYRMLGNDRFNIAENTEAIQGGI